VASGGIVLACACFVASGVAWFSISKGKMPCPLLGYRGIHISGAGCVGFHIQFLGWAAKVHIFSNEGPEVCPDLEKGGCKRKKRRPPAFSRRGTFIVCGRLPSTTVNTYPGTYPTFCSTSSV
jgi:hypothetical protein